MSGTPHLDKILALSEVKGYERTERGREEFIHGFSRAGSKAFGDLRQGDYVHMPDNRVYQVTGRPTLLGEGTHTIGGRRVSVSATHALQGHTLRHVRTGKTTQAAALSYHQVSLVQPRTGMRRMAPGVNEEKRAPSPRRKLILGAADRQFGAVSNLMDQRL
jgi:hypothetical protein